MLKAAKLTDGTGARIALNILCTSIKDALIDRILTFMTSARQKKTTKTAQHKNSAINHLAPPISVPRDSCVQGSKMSESFDFRVRGIVSLAVGFIILIAGVSLYFKLNTRTSFLSAVLGFSIPFFFIGGLLLRAHVRVKKGQPPFGL